MEMYRSARAVDQRRDRGPLACVVASDVEKGLMAVSRLSHLRVARNSASRVHVDAFGYRASPRQWKVCVVIFGEGPTRLGAVRADTFLKNVRSVPPADLFLVVPTDRVRPRDAPRLGRSVPRAQRGAIHVHRPIGIGTTLIAPRHYPNVLHGTSFEHTRGVDLSV